MAVRDFIKYYYYHGIKLLRRYICICPIKDNRIVFMSHRGASQYSDSPKYITEYLLRYYPDKYEIIWEVNDLEKFAYLHEKGIKTVKYGTFKDYYLLNTSRVCVTNCGFPAFLIKRKKQLRINTWHAGVAYKSEEITGRRKEKNTSSYAKKLKADIKNHYNLMLSSCKTATDTYIRGSFMYKGELLECGLPRNDIMFSHDENIKRKVRKWFSLDDETDILLVAPTWKDNGDIRNIQMDYGEICRALEEKTNHKWVVLLRLHHLTNINIDDLVQQYNGKVIKASDYPDVQELIYTANMLITDYSSLIWDFALTEKAIILYTPDIEEYDQKRGFYMPVDEWGLAYAQNNDELLNILKETSIEELEENSRAHLAKFESYEKGNATKEVVNRIVSFCEEKSR